MSFKAKLIQSMSLCIAVAATPVMAQQSTAAGKSQSIRLTCPAGTVQKGGKVSKDQGTFCVKAAQAGNEPVLHGPYIDFWANGQKQSEGQYLDGARSGRWTFWDANGVKTGETEFVAGDYSGTRVEYYSNGNKKLEQMWVKGKKEGLETAYAEDGKKIYEAEFKGGQSVKEQRFDNGRAAAK